MQHQVVLLGSARDLRPQTGPQWQRGWHRQRLRCSSSACCEKDVGLLSVDGSDESTPLSFRRVRRCLRCITISEQGLLRLMVTLFQMVSSPLGPRACSRRRAKEFKDADSIRSGNSHVTSRPVSFPPHPIPEGMLSRSFGVPSRREGPPSIWDTHGISGNVFANPDASSSAPYPQELNSWSSGREEPIQLINSGKE